MASEILERKITTPSRPEFLSLNQGVALVIINRRAEVLLGQQSTADCQYGRRADQWNIFTETREIEEKGIKTTVRRGVTEELGVDFDDFTPVPGSYRETNGVYVQLTGFPFLFRCIVLQYNGDETLDPNKIFRSQDGEISGYHWVNPVNFHLYDIELGARLVLNYYFNQKGGL